MKPLLIGEAPSKNEYPPTPLEGRIGKRLAALAGLTFEEFLERFDRVNLLDVRQDTREKGFEFDMASARKNALAAWARFKAGQTVILLGKRVADAFGLKTVPYFQGVTLSEARVYVMPHPSGVSRWWNDPANVKQAEEFMRGIVREMEPQTFRRYGHRFEAPLGTDYCIRCGDVEAMHV